jgi:hypothetical protein
MEKINTDELNFLVSGSTVYVLDKDGTNLFSAHVQSNRISEKQCMVMARYIAAKANG